MALSSPRKRWSSLSPHKDLFAVLGMFLLLSGTLLPREGAPFVLAIQGPRASSSWQSTNLLPKEALNQEGGQVDTGGIRARATAPEEEQKDTEEEEETSLLMEDDEEEKDEEEGDQPPHGGR